MIQGLDIINRPEGLYTVIGFKYSGDAVLKGQFGEVQVPVSDLEYEISSGQSEIIATEFFNEEIA